jgi:hypothetical protein
MQQGSGRRWKPSLITTWLNVDDDAVPLHSSLDPANARWHDGTAGTMIAIACHHVRSEGALVHVAGLSYLYEHLDPSALCGTRAS